MPVSANASTERGESSEVLYESPATRVVRLEDASGARLVLKEYLGADAAQRLRNEKALLRRLAGMEGVAQLAEGAHGAGVLSLRDCGGVSLAIVMQAGRCGIETVLSMACRLAGTLSEVHRAGVIHRDINPANILVCAAGDAMLIDFDLATLAQEHVAVQPGGQIVGTLSHMAPEQSGRTGHPVDQRADLYALGVTLYEMATGRLPFEQVDALQLIHDHLVREPVAPSQLDADVPPALSGIILRLMAKAPEQRYQSAEGLLHDLQRVRGELRQGRGGVFELGERDFPARLAPPERLVGRDAELASLLNAFADAMRAPGRTVLIGGPVGVGKSVLINELRPVVAAAGGWFAYGKFDQYQKDASTAGAVTQALQALGRLLLTQSGDPAAALRQRILDSLGRNAGFITRASAEFALLLGSQPDVPEIDPRQAELQLQQAMLDLLGAIVSPECPLVLVVDDLQWGGAFSLRVFERLMDAELRGLFLVGAYRSEGEAADHILAPLLARGQQHAQPPTQIALANLTVAGTGEMIGQMLRLAPGPSRELAQALNVLTAGNPFDTVEMINALRDDGVLSLEESGWQWDEAKVRSYVGRGNVVDLLAARIGRLPAASRELLEFMSCLGSAVDCKLLCAAVGLGDGELRARLRAPLEDGLLVANESAGQDSVSFRHDRVQQAMLGAMDEAQRGRRELAMARRLAGERGFESAAAEQYLACVGLVGEPEEQRRAALLFHGLAQKLASSATYALAERYLAAADQLLAAIDEPGDAPARLAIGVARHRALYSLGRVEEADPLYAQIQARSEHPQDLVEPTCLQIRSLGMRGRMVESLTLGVRLLRQLGLQVPADFTDQDREQRLDALSEWIRQESRLDPSARAQTREPRLLGISKLLSRMMGAAHHSGNADAFAWMLLESQRLWVEHGPCGDLMSCVSSAGDILVGGRQDYRTSYEIARHVVHVGEALGFEVRTAGARFLFAWRSCPWVEPLESALEHATRACEVFQARGDDPSFGCYFDIPKYMYSLEIKPTIESCAAAMEAALGLSRRTGNINAAALHTCAQQLVRALRGQTNALDSLDDEQFSEPKFTATFGHLPNVGIALAHYHSIQSLIGGDLAGLCRHAPAIPTGGDYGVFYRTMHAHLCVALARAWQIRQCGPSAAESAPLIAELESCRGWIAARASDQPYNFLHLLRLVEAEQAWALGDRWKAIATFDQALLEAESRQRPWHRAVITERAGLFNLSSGLTSTGRDLLAKARDQYEAWGASAKVEQMRREHPFLRAPARSLSSQMTGSAGHATESNKAVSLDVLDLVGVLRASQALSSETSLERLTDRVSEVLASLSGATKVLVLSFNEGQWRLLSHLVAPGMPVEQAARQGLLPLSAFAYAERTGQALIVEDAPGDDRFARDPYFADVHTCSLLIVPIAAQGAIRGMLLLENRLGRAAFNAQRLDAVMLIAGQLAVSLANAQLYESLELRVQARTRELQETQAELVTTARRAGMAEIANNVLHNVGNVLNSINVSANVLRDTLGDFRIDGLARAVGLIKENEDDLPRFIETDPRGKMLVSYLDELAGQLRSEQQQAMSDLDRLRLGVEHIIYVVATQQAHAGPSSVVEMVGPQQLVEEALNLSAEAINGRKVVVVRRYEDVPASVLDKQRLVQILVNLIGNASQAMERVPAQARQLTLGIARVRGEHGERMRITVQDTGEGIAAENITRIFAHGFTTRASGHGFGLHSSALAATEMGGKLTVRSEGPGRGATFTIDLPIRT